MNKNLFSKSLIVGLAAACVLPLAGCKKKNGNNENKYYFAFSVGMKSGTSAIQIGNNNESIEVYNNGVDTSGRSYTYTSLDEDVASIDANGKITPIKPGKVNFVVTETKSGMMKQLKKEIVIYSPSEKSNGGYNFSGGTTMKELGERAEILGALEKYAMDTHLTGITLFDNGGYVKYANRVELPTNGQYVEGYGFGVLTEGKLHGHLSGQDGGNDYPDYYHTSISQDPIKINQFTATGSQVSDLAAHITSSYWNTRLKGTSEYEWYPCLAADRVKAPKINEQGQIIGYEAEDVNKAPIPMDHSENSLHKKWRIYVKTDGVHGANLKYTTASSKLQGQGFNNRGVTIQDYVFAYKLLLTGWATNIVRGTEMANDSSYGIKGAQRYFNETNGAVTQSDYLTKWNEFTAINPTTGESKLGLQSGHDTENDLDYLDIELINPIDSFTAMYTLSSSLVSPLPEDLFWGDKAIVKNNIGQAIDTYGTFNSEGDGAILDYTLCLGAYTLTKWDKNSQIVFVTNQNWFEVDTPTRKTGRYYIPGIYYRRYNVSEDSYKNWKQLNSGDLDSAGVPSEETSKEAGKPNVYETKGDSTFKLNINSCTQEEWNVLFDPKDGKFPADEKWSCKPWMSNQDFLDGLFYSIDREAFAKKRGVTPSINYFSDAYQMRNETEGMSYNAYDAHKEAVSDYSLDYGYNYDRAVDCFRNAVIQLSRKPAGKGIVLGPDADHPTEIHIHIMWMYKTDIKEYGNDIKAYFETAFNDPAVCGGRVKLVVDQDNVTNWEDVYNVYMMQGRFDLGFGAISGNTYNPLNFLEVLKSDNSSQFTLNWGQDTSKVDDKNPIIYKGEKWSFDALWEVADHGGLVENGEKVKAVKSLIRNRPTKLDGSGDFENDLYNGFKMVLPVEFAESESAVFDANRLDIAINNGGVITLAEKGDPNNTIVYNKTKHQIEVTVSAEKAAEVNQTIKTKNGYTDTDDEEWHKNPFVFGHEENFDFEFYYSLSINGGAPSINYAEIAHGDN